MKTGTYTYNGNPFLEKYQAPHVTPFAEVGQIVEVRLHGSLTRTERLEVESVTWSRWSGWLYILRTSNGYKVMTQADAKQRFVLTEERLTQHRQELYLVLGKPTAA